MNPELKSNQLARNIHSVIEADVSGNWKIFIRGEAKIALPRRERNKVSVTESLTTPHPVPLPQGERGYLHRVLFVKSVLLASVKYNTVPADR